MHRRPRIGFHAPITGGIHQALIVAKDTGCDTVQIFSRNPRGWMAKPLLPDDVLLFKQTRKLTRISPVLIHCNYLVNLAGTNELFLKKSVEVFRGEIERALALCAEYLVLHPGSFRGHVGPALRPAHPFVVPARFLRSRAHPGLVG